MNRSKRGSFLQAIENTTNCKRGEVLPYFCICPKDIYIIYQILEFMLASGEISHLESGGNHKTLLKKV